MPVSKRNISVSLTKTKKKGLENKQKLVTETREAVENFETIFLFSIENMRNNKLKEIREEWKSTSKFILGKNKVLQLALGRNAENEVADNIHKISDRLIGQCGLFFTSQPEQEVIEWFDNYRESEFARSGFVATEKVILREDDLIDFSHAMEPQFRKLGLPTALKNGKIKLLSDFTVCEEGDTLTPEMADVLKLKGIQMAEFHVTLECVWRKDGSFSILQEKDERSAAEIKKVKSKRNKAKRPKLAVIPTAETNEDSDEDDEEEDDEDDDGDDLMDQDDNERDDEEEKQEEEKLKKQKENRPIKKAVRKSKVTEEPVEVKEKPKKTVVDAVKKDDAPRRVTRSSMKGAK